MILRKDRKENREEYTFKKGYSLFQIKEYELAKNQFKKIMNSDGGYAIEANYYYGYQCYILKDYTCALATFTKIGDKGPKTMQLYMAQIYYENQSYDKAFEIVQNLPMPEIPCSNIKNISSGQCDSLTKRKQDDQSEPLLQTKKRLLKVSLPISV